MRYLRLGGMELRRYRRGQLGRAALVAIILLPLLYGTVYLIAFWDPYKNLTDVPAAIVNQDVPVKSNGQRIAIGQSLTDGLVSSGSLEWSVVDAETARAGLDLGEYFFIVEIPPGTSSSVKSLGTDSPTPALLKITTNDANSYLTSLIAQNLSSGIQSSMNQSIVQSFVDTSLRGIQKIRKSLGKAADGSAQLTAGTAKANSGSTQLASGAGQVAAGNQELASVADQARGYAQDAVSVSDRVVRRLERRVHRHPKDLFAALLLDGARQAHSVIVDVANQVDSAVGKIDELSTGSAELASGAAQLSTGMSQLLQGSQQLTTGLQNGTQQIPDWSAAQTRDIANHVSFPVVVQSRQINDAGTYGAGFAPYFMGMSLWVALMIVFMLLQPIPTRVLLAPNIGSLGVTTIAMIPVVTLTLAQVAILLLVIHFGLGISPAAFGFVALFAFLVLVAVTYAALIQLINATLGTAGRLVALVVLMLQLCSSGGTYPVEMSPEFFKTISPYLPMTYAISGLRHILAGGARSVIWGDVAVLAGMAAAAIALTTAFVATHRRLTLAQMKPEISL